MFGRLMRKYAYVILASLFIFQTSLLVLSEQNIRYSLGPSSAKIMMHNIENTSTAVNCDLRSPLSRFLKFSGQVFFANHFFQPAKSEDSVHSACLPSPAAIGRNDIDLYSEHIFLPLLDLTLLI